MITTAGSLLIPARSRTALSEASPWMEFWTIPAFLSSDSITAAGQPISPLPSASIVKSWYCHLGIRGGSGWLCCSSTSSSSSNSNDTSSSSQNCPTFDELVPTTPINVDENSTTISGLSLPTGCNIEVLSIIQSDPVNSNGINPGWFGDLTQGEKTPFGNSDGSTLVITSDTTIGNANEITQLVSDIQIADGVTVTIGGNLHCDLKEIQTYNGILKAEKVKLRYCHIRAGGGDSNAPVGRIELKGVSMMRGTFAVPSGGALYTQYMIEDSFLYDLIDGTGNIYSYIWYPREEGIVVKNSVFYMHGGFDIGFRSSSLTSPPIIDNNVFL